MCFAPQRRALFRHRQLPKVVRDRQFLTLLTSKCASRHNGVHFFWHLNFQKWSENGVFCIFSLGNVLRAITACNFSSFLWLAGSATRRFSEPTFRPSGATNHWKNTVFRDFPYLFAHLYLLCSYFFFSDLLFLLIFLFSLPLPCSAFYLSILSEVWLLNVTSIN